MKIKWRQNVAVVGGRHGGTVAGQYLMHVQLTPSAAVTVGGQLDVSCDIWNRQPERSMFVVWLRRSHGSEVELCTNVEVVDQLKDRYSARKELRGPADYTRVSYYLTISGMNVRLLYVQHILQCRLSSEYISGDSCLMRISITY